MKPWVEYNTENITIVNQNKLNELIELAYKSKEKKYRFCLQHSESEILQEMIIVALKGEYYRPHKHLYIPESNLILKGEMLVIVFDDGGNILKAEILNEKKNFLFRVENGYYHVSIPLTDEVTFLETKLGPFEPATNVFPTWAPTGQDEIEAKEYMRKLLNSIIG